MAISLLLCKYFVPLEAHWESMGRGYVGDGAETVLERQTPDDGYDLEDAYGESQGVDQMD